MNPIEYREGLPDEMAFFRLFETTGWNRENPMTPEFLYAGVRNSWYIVNAYDHGQLIGTTRVLSDQRVYALVVDVIVAPTHRRQGIGQELMKRAIAHCRQQGIRNIQLFCARGYQPFYEGLGFVARHPEAPAMFWKNLPEADR